MEFDWTEDHLDLRRGAVEFASTRLVEGVSERDREGAFSRQLWDACAEFGLQGLLVPSEWKGSGQDLLSAIVVMEGIGYGARDNGLVFSVAAHAASCEGPLHEFGTEAQKQEWLPRLADGSVIGATGITEPDSGSNALALGTSAVESGGDWVLDGSKTFVTNAPLADLFLIYARTGGSGFAGLTCFLVPRETEGLTVGAPIAKMGLRTSPMAQVFLEGCRLPGSAVLGGVGSGAMIFNQTMDVERLLVMAPSVGVMERLLETVSFEASDRSGLRLTIDAAYVDDHLAELSRDEDLSRYIL